VKRMNSSKRRSRILARAVRERRERAAAAGIDPTDWKAVMAADAEHARQFVMGARDRCRCRCDGNKHDTITAAHLEA